MSPIEYAAVVSDVVSEVVADGRTPMDVLRKNVEAWLVPATTTLGLQLVFLLCLNTCNYEVCPDGQRQKEAHRCENPLEVPNREWLCNGSSSTYFYRCDPMNVTSERDASCYNLQMSIQVLVTLVVYMFPSVAFLIHYVLIVCRRT